VETVRGPWAWFRSDVEPRDPDVRLPREPPAAQLWIVGAVAFSLVLAGAVYWTWDHQQLDFAVYVMGSHHLTDSRLYDVRLLYTPHLPFTYPPFAALVFWPLSLMALRVGQTVWDVVNVFALLAMIVLTLNVVRPRWSLRTRLASSMAFLVPAALLEPVSLTFTFGQINLVLAALVLADLTGHLTLARRTLPRGVLIGLCAAVKLVPLIFIPYLFFTRQRRAAYTAVATFVVSSLLAAAFNPIASWSYWTRYVVDATRMGGTVYLSNQSLRGSFDRLTHRLWGADVTTLLAAVVAVAGVAVAVWAWRRSSPLLGGLLVATSGLLASPITWAHHMVWIVPVLLWLIWGVDRPRYGWVWAGLGGVLYYWAPIWAAPHVGSDELREHGWQLVRANSFFFSMVLFMVVTAVMLLVRSRASARS
jgi:alpha-1,2-mannosyltransferase